MTHRLPTLLLLALPLVAPEMARACSIRSDGLARSTLPAFVFTASLDTAPVPAWAPVERRPPEMPSRFGQLVQVTSLAEGEQPEARAALEASEGRAVLVPWSLTADCRTARWERSHRWVTSPEPAFVHARLRPRAAWADGIPTFDVTVAYREPFPHERWLRARRFRAPPKELDPGGLLTAEEYFRMHGALPTREEWDRAPEESYERIRQWVDAHPRLAAKYPASTLLEEAAARVRSHEREAELEKLRTSRPPSPARTGSM